MKQVSKSHRVLAIIMGIAILVTMVWQILRDDRQLELKNIGNIQSTTK